MAISIKECIHIIECGEWCNLRLITADVKKGTGGKLLEIRRARIARKNQPSAATVIMRRDAKPANHSENFTRNIELPNKRIITIHPILITHINQEPVL
jgi:hypothetical protein